MLGGYGFIHSVDAHGSLELIKKLLPPHVITKGRALDIGAGIGRVTQHVLIPAGFPTVDLIDACDKFLQEAASKIDPTRLGDVVTSSFTGFDFMRDKGRTWTLIWMQWCAIYLRDDEFGEFFARACASLDSDGPSYVVLKENILRQGEAAPVPDNDDHSVTRSDAHLKKLWKNAGVEVVAQQDQANLPTTIYPVRMYALRLAERK